jgi:hypothetical protein
MHGSNINKNNDNIFKIRMANKRKEEVTVF